uniref:CSON001278 protein n=1 Tax=Culicoides sonorensis TaxID=179676 RepID=A0A336KY02_CULSO
MLRPSQFQINSGNTSDSEKTFKLKPSQLNVTSPTPSSLSSSNSGNNISNNITSKEAADDPESSNSNSATLFGNPFMRGFSKDEDSPSKPDEEKKEEKEKKDENLDPLTKLSSTGGSSSAGALPKSNLFNVKAATLSSGSGFVFGQNIGARVTGTNQSTNLFGSATTKKEEENGESKSTSEDASSCNGAGSSNAGLFFSNAASNNAEPVESKKVDGKSLLEATREYEEKVKVQKRKYEEVETVTGEEDERNIVEFNCKLFAFEDRNYEERGRGMLRLNDSKGKQNESRVVFRTSGNLRVLINTKVWSKMIVEKPSTKSMRMTAIDTEGHIKVFLVQARPDDITQLYKYLSERVNKLKAIEEDLEQKSKDLADAESPQKCETFPISATKTSPAQTICIKINDHETGEDECKKITPEDQNTDSSDDKTKDD